MVSINRFFKRIMACFKPKVSFTASAKFRPPVGPLASGLESLSGSDSPEASGPTGGSLRAINKQVRPFTNTIND